MNPRFRVPSRMTLYRLLAVAVAVVPALLISMSSPAQAATINPVGKAVVLSSSDIAALPSCPTSTLCTFQNSGYGGTRWNFAYSSRPHNTWFFVGSAANDQISSFYNHRAWTSYFAKACPAGSNWAASAGGSAVSNLNDGQHTWQDGTNANDSISSIALGTSTGISYPNHGGC
jgi:Peptidase inhibitor family I36